MGRMYRGATQFCKETLPLSFFFLPIKLMKLDLYHSNATSHHPIALCNLNLIICTSLISVLIIATLHAKFNILEYLNDSNKNPEKISG